MARMLPPRSGQGEPIVKPEKRRFGISLRRKTAKLCSVSEQTVQRLFVAISLPTYAKEALKELAALLPAGVSPAKPEQMHLTLRFLGDTPAALADAAKAKLAEARVEPFFLPLAGAGAFPPRGRPAVFWAGVGAGHPRLFQLRQKVDDALLAAGIDFDPRSFVPHITLARVPAPIDEKETRRFLETHASFESAPFKVDSFGLFSSELRAGGAVHRLEHEFPLQP
jgi:RNA 2',3'-cyclic 3'-phosphodiesterase